MDPCINEYENEPTKTISSQNVLIYNELIKNKKYIFILFHMNIRSIHKTFQEL